MPKKLAQTGDNGGGIVYCTLRAYLDNLKSYEQSRPKERRRDVPSITALAEAINVNRVTLSNIANGKTQSLDYRIAGKIIDELRRRGFDTDVSDLLAYRAPEAEETAL